MHRSAVIVGCIGVAILGVAAAILIMGGHFAVLSPKGLIASNERSLIIHAVLLMLIVIVPVYALAFGFAWYYRAGNKKAVYTPDWEHSKMEELIWWAVPLEIILVLGALTWSSTHELDPYKPLQSNQKPLVIQVVALPWKWLFIYPEEGVATINELPLPVNRPIEFDVTADAPMNSFWIPELGGQIYAMTGMVTKLHLIANTPGNYEGGSANYSGEGFAEMKFTARGMTAGEFDEWVRSLKNASTTLDRSEYALIAKPGSSLPTEYASVQNDLYNTILGKYMDEGMSEGMHTHEHDE